jgi:hypothetical protein
MLILNHHRVFYLFNQFTSAVSLFCPRIALGILMDPDDPFIVADQTSNPQ